MIKPLSKSKPLFCEQYWKNIAKNTKPVKEYKCKVSTNFDLHDANMCFYNNGSNFFEKHFEKETGKTLQEFIAQTDKEFKQITPTDKPLVLWRGIRPPMRNMGRFPKFERSYNCKAGDKIFMPEYAFAAADEQTAKEFAKNFFNDNKNGILYKIFVPKGSKINHWAYYNFPRFSLFECIKTKEIIKDNQSYKLITLRYIQPEEVKLEPKEKVLNFFEKLTRLFK